MKRISIKHFTCFIFCGSLALNAFSQETDSLIYILQENNSVKDYLSKGEELILDEPNSFSMGSAYSIIVCTKGSVNEVQKYDIIDSAVVLTHFSVLGDSLTPIKKLVAMVNLVDPITALKGYYQCYLSDDLRSHYYTKIITLYQGKNIVFRTIFDGVSYDNRMLPNLKEFSGLHSFFDVVETENSFQYQFDN